MRDRLKNINIVLSLCAASFLAFYLAAQQPTVEDPAATTGRAVVTKEVEHAAPEVITWQAVGGVLLQSEECRRVCSGSYRTCVSGCNNLPEDRRMSCNQGCINGYNACVKRCTPPPPSIARACTDGAPASCLGTSARNPSVTRIGVN